MKFKNFEGVEYSIRYLKPSPHRFKFKVDGMCDNPESQKPSILIDPELKDRRQLNVLIEEIFHAHFWDLPEKKARKFAANLGKAIYKKFLSKK
jgi:hypothetical protein